ncbi:MAG TPA: hypothetical protein VGS10_23410 [Terracidiphilus sp.]|nr:hypothetical protein [Terracidiphilus sp.]
MTISTFFAIAWVAGRSWAAQAKWMGPGCNLHCRPSWRRSGLACGLVCVLTLAIAAPLLAQTREAVFDSEAYGFTYRLPIDWQVAPEKTVLPAAKQNAEQSAKNPNEILGIACAQVVFSANRGKPPSVVVVVALPFSCYGQAMTAKNLSGFASGVSEGLKQNFDITDPVYGTYALGTHSFWVERAVGAPKNHAQTAYTLEIVCTVLKRTAACWLTLADDATALRDFEHSLVTLDGEPPVILVPIDAFVKKPLSAAP